MRRGPKLELNGIHHITAITSDAQANLDFYVGTLGLRFVKKTVNFDAPDVYHLYYGDRAGEPGSLLTFFEFPGAARGRPGHGMIHRLAWRVASEASLDHWTGRLESAGVAVERGPDHIRFDDPEGLGLELTVDASGDRPLVAAAPEMPEEHALRGFEGVRAFARAPGASESPLADALGFIAMGDDAYRVQGDSRMSTYAYDRTGGPGVQGGGTVHHIAWAARPEDHDVWRDRVETAGLDVTPIIDRVYFRSIYFREPSGVLFEIATVGPGFTLDEPLESLGESLMLPSQHEHLRSQLERTLTPLRDPHRAAIR